MNTFTAIDFETAHPKRWSICQVGLVRVEMGVITKKLSMLVQPPDNFYWSMFTNIHGITPAMTENALTFDSIWEKIEPFIRGQDIVAHNIGFDSGCLAGTLEYYGLELPTYTKHCTYRLYGKGLAACYEEHKIKLKHHDALSDAVACAELFKRYLGVRGKE